MAKNTMKIKAISVVFLIGIIFYFLSLAYLSTQKNLTPVLTPNLQIEIDKIDASKSFPLQMMIGLAHELNNYKNQHRSYPKSGDKGNDWTFINSDDGIIVLDSSFKINISRLIDKKNLTKNVVFIYRSNGAHYKLVTKGMDDCTIVRDISSRLIVDSDACKGYGIWTSYHTIGWGEPPL